MAAIIRWYVQRHSIRIYSPDYVRYIVKHRRTIWRLLPDIVRIQWRLIRELFHIIQWWLYGVYIPLYYIAHISVLQTFYIVQVGQAQRACYRLAMRLYGVYMRLYGVYMAYYGVYIVGYAVMAYGLGLRDRRWDRRWVWRVGGVVVVCAGVVQAWPIGRLWRVCMVGVGVWQALVYGVYGVCGYGVRCYGVGCTYGQRVCMRWVHVYGVRCVYVVYIDL